ncbi:MAG: ATP-binding protein [Oscillospiraceae bacterium]|nr:ATP-binding protein [Oscillospiraceae bacterium]
MIGRKEEQRLLNELAMSGEAEFVVIYGRRRIGKTFLVREVFENNFFFSYTGVANRNAQQQRIEFDKSLREHGWTPGAGGSDVPVNWFDSFDALRDLIERANTKDRLLIFIDEMPWMDNKKSDFVPAFENFWNGWASGQKNIMLIVCGSAASWVTKKIFRNKGGLYNRVTRQIALKPFTLFECREYFISRGVAMNTQDLIESYMIFGGIPYYLRMIEKRYSLALNVDRICFGETAPLRYEFDRLMDTLFTNPKKHIRVLEALHTKKQGMTRETIANLIDFGNGGNLTRILHELGECGFIRKYKPFGKGKNSALYHLADPFTAFHLTFISKTDDENYWSSFTDNASHRAWSGYAFEQVCLSHVNQIKEALGISGVHTDTSSWVSRGGENGAQIDLVIDRADRVINLCEIKFAKGPFEIDRAYDLALRGKTEMFRSGTKTRKSLHLTMITTYGVKPGKYAGIVQSEVNMDELIER